MVRLHLIGFTTDLKNLIFATRRSAKRGGYIVEIDKRLLGALEEVAKLEVEAKGRPAGEVAPADRESPSPAARSSSLSPREIQALLREGKSEDQVAKLAEADVSWIRRFTGPIIAERAGVIDSVRAGSIAKSRLGPSALPIGQAIQMNLNEKRIRMDQETFDRSWKASRRSGLWQVVFQYSSRGKRKLARFVFDPESRAVTAANTVALEVGWRPNSLKRPRRPDGGQGQAKKTARGTKASSTRAGRPPARKKTTRKKAAGGSVQNGRGAATVNGRGTRGGSKASRS